MKDKVTEYPLRLRPFHFLWCWFVAGHAGPINCHCRDCGSYVSYHAIVTRHAQDPIWLRLKKWRMDGQFERKDNYLPLVRQQKRK